MSDAARTRLGGWIVALGGVGVIVGAAFLTAGDLDWRPGVSFGLGVVVLALGGFVMGSASESYRRGLFSRWGYVAGLSQGGWNPDRKKAPDD